VSIDNNEILKNRARNTRKKSDGSKTKKVIQVAATTVLLGSAVIPVVAVQTAHAAATTGTLELLDSQGVVAANAAAGEVLTIRVTDTNNSDNYLDTSAATADSFNIAVSSPDDPARSPLNITLTETGINTGIFVGTLVLVDPINASPTANEVRVSNTHTVTIVDNGPHPLTPIVQNVTRKDHVTGSFRTLDTDVSGAVINNLVNQGQQVYVELTDNDLNLDGSIVNTRNVNVTTTAGVAGQTLLLTETGANSGVFGGLFTVGANSVTPANQGDIFIEYADDKKLDNLSGTITKTLTRKDYSAATLVLSTPNVNGKAAFDETVTVTLTDDDLAAQNATTTVTLTSPDDSPKTMTLTQTGANTGVFTGTFKLSPTAATYQINVANGSSVAVSYTDLRNISGSTSSVTHSVQRKDHGTAVLSFDKSFAVVGEVVTVTLDDSDHIDGISGGTAAVTVTSTSYAPGRIRQEFL
jgi:hypothetical protein